ncbi:MAG: hypothetical protein IJK28_10595 [Clostridia bacterium]|nr:hypothetical protein [Clostridia bacterium]
MASRKTNAKNLNSDVTDSINTEPRQNKTRRVQIMIIPADFERFQAFAHLAGSNVNQLLNDFIHETVTKYADRIADYEQQRDELRKEFRVTSNE